MANLSNPVTDLYRCPPAMAALSAAGPLDPAPGFFSFGAGVTCYGQSRGGSPAVLNGTPLPDLAGEAVLSQSALRLPFDAAQAVDNLRFERYPVDSHAGVRRFLLRGPVQQIYYGVRELLGDSLRRRLQRLYFRDWEALRFPAWPVDTTVERLLENLLRISMSARGIDRMPFVWFWPEGAPAAAILTHDVETADGLERVSRLMDLNASFGLKSSFQLIPGKRYTVPRGLVDAIHARGCEVNVHGLHHDGNFFGHRRRFAQECRLINHYAREFGARGFRSPCMYRNPEWHEELEVEFDMSVPNVAHLDPQRGGCCSVFPYFAGRILELPLTTTQDYSLFHMLGDYSTGLWMRQIGMILERHGLISLNLHPDYLFTARALPVYRSLLAHLSSLASSGRIWAALPGEVNDWWRERQRMEIVRQNGKWRIVGPGRERARLAFARRGADGIVYNVESSWQEA